MICQKCAEAAKAHLPAEDHCDSTAGEGARCFCQHRTDRYRPQAVTEILPGLIIYSGPL